MGPVLDYFTKVSVTVLLGLAVGAFLPRVVGPPRHRGTGLGAGGGTEAKLRADSASLLSLGPGTGGSGVPRLLLPQDRFLFVLRRSQTSETLPFPGLAQTCQNTRWGSNRDPPPQLLPTACTLFSFDQTWPRSQSSRELAKTVLQPDYLRT